MKKETRLLNLVKDLTNNDESKAIAFSGNLDYGVEEFVGVSFEDDTIYVTTKDGYDMPITGAEDELGEPVINDVLEELNGTDFEVVDLDNLYNE